jgi:hypothetical protein
LHSPVSSLTSLSPSPEPSPKPPSNLRRSTRLQPIPQPRRSNRTRMKPKQTGARHTGGRAPRKVFSSSDTEDYISEGLSSSVSDLQIRTAVQGTMPGRRRSLSLSEYQERSNLVCCFYLSLFATNLTLFFHSGA